MPLKVYKQRVLELDAELICSDGSAINAQLAADLPWLRVILNYPSSFKAYTSSAINIMRIEE